MPVYYTEIKEDFWAWDTWRGFTSVAVAKKYYNPEFFSTMRRATQEEIASMASSGGLGDIQVISAKDVKHPKMQNMECG